MKVTSNIQVLLLPHKTTPNAPIRQRDSYEVGAKQSHEKGSPGLPWTGAVDRYIISIMKFNVLQLYSAVQRSHVLDKSHRTDCQTHIIRDYFPGWNSRNTSPKPR